MAKIRLQQETLVYCPETSFGQLPASPEGTKLNVLSESIGVSTASRVFQEGLLSYYHGHVVRHVSVAGEVRTYIYPSFFFDMIKAAMRGSVSTVGSGPYTHTITLAGREYSFIFERDVADINKYLRYMGCRIGAARFNFPTSGPAEIVFSILGLREEKFNDALDSTLDEVDEEPYFAEDMVLYVEEEAQSGFISGTATLNVDMKVGRYAPKTQRAIEIWPGNVGAEGSVNMFTENVTRLGWERNTELRNIEFWLARSGNSFRIRFKSVRITRVSRPFISRGDYAQTIEFQGAKDGSKLPVELIVINEQTSI